jgi:hypothetical protein
MGKDIFVNRKIMNQYGKLQSVDYHGYLYGLISAFKFKKDKEFHSMILITGSVGSGKSSLVEGLAALDADLNNIPLTFDNISWRTEPFIEKMERSDNIGHPQIFDESVMGITGKSIGNTKIGFKLKVGLITRRFKKHTYYLLVDEISEYSLKLIKMCDAWINVRTMGTTRGYFDCYTNKSKIEFLYNAFKNYNKTWTSPVVKGVNPDCKGTFMDFSGKFLKKSEYSKKKDEETKQLTEADGGKKKEINWTLQKMKAYNLWLKGGITHLEIGKAVGVKRSAVSNWVSEDFKDLI